MVMNNTALSPGTWLTLSRLIPIASIITPATLSVVSKAMEPQPIHKYYVPTINFDTRSYVAGLSAAGSGRYYPQKLTYEGPSQALQRMTTALGTLGNILPIDPPSSNSSWDTEFRGPAIRCDPFSASDSSAIEQNIREYIKSGSVCLYAPGYITWFGDLPSDENGRTISDAEPVVEPNGQLSSDGDARFRLALLPTLLTVVDMSTGQVASACASNFDNVLGSVNNDTSLMLQCRLVEATYHVSFEYVNGNQTVAIEVPRTTQDEPVTAINTITGPTNETCVGFHAGYLLKQTNPPTPDPDWPERCDFDPGLARQLAYKSMLDAFFNLIGGIVALDQSSAGTILATTLVRSRELHFLTNYARTMENPWPDGQNAQSGLFKAGRTDVAGLTIPEPMETRPALATELEVMFQNLTVSLMSSTTFQ
jgi:hypothetical protein